MSEVDSLSSSLQVRNDSGEIVPAFGVMRVTGAVEVKGHAVLTVEQPDDSDAPCLINGPTPIADGKYGTIQPGPIVAAYFEGSASVGDVLGPEDGEWKLTSDGEGWIYLGTTGGQVGLFRMATGSEAVEVKIGKPDANIAKGATGTVSVWDGEPGSEADTGDNLTALAKARAVTTGKFVTLTRLVGKTGWYVDCWES